MRDTHRRILSYYVTFLKIGCFTFGGGLNIVAQIQKKYVEEEKLITAEELLDTFCIGRSLPGTMVTNVTYLFGYQNGGILCGISCVLGLITAPALVLMLIAVSYHAVRGNVYIEKALTGVRAAVVPIILSAILKMLKTAFPSWICIPVAAGAFAAFYFLSWNSLLIVALGGLCGMAIYPVLRKGGDRK